MARPVLSALLVPVALAVAAPAAAAPPQRPARIVRVHRDGATAVARGRVPSGFGPGSLAAATDGEGHVLGIVRLAGAAGRRWRLEAVDALWPHALRRGLDLHWFATEGVPGTVVWCEALGARLLVDGTPRGTLPAAVRLGPGPHELVAELPGGVRAGARVAAPPERPALPLFGIGWPMGAEPSLALEDAGRPPEVPGGIVRWVEVPGYGRFYHPGGPVHEPVKERTVPPEYPDELRRAHVLGWARLLLLVGEDGAVRAVARLGAARPEFERLATRAALRWRYRPATLDGRPVPAVEPLLVRWRLR